MGEIVIAPGFRRTQPGKGVTRYEAAVREHVSCRRCTSPWVTSDSRPYRRATRQPERRSVAGSLSRVAVGAISGWLLYGQPAVAAENFIQLHIAAQGGCGNPAATPLAFVLAGQDFLAPFGKAAQDWSDDDLAALRSTLAACQATSAQAGNPSTFREVKGDSEDLLTRIPLIVAKARAQAAAKAQQVEARRQIAAARIDKGAQAKQQAQASAETQAAHLEDEAATAEADARDAQRRLDQRLQRASRARDEAKARAAAIAGIERTAEADAGTLPKARPAAPGELSELVGDDEASPNGKKAGPLTVTAITDTLACRTIDAVTAGQQASSPQDKAGPAPLASDACRTLAKGTRVTVQVAAAGANTRTLCVTLAGQPGCFWVAKAAFGSDGQ